MLKRTFLTLAVGTVIVPVIAEENPLLHPWTEPYGGVPPLGRVEVQHFEPALEAAMSESLQEIEAIAGQEAELYTAFSQNVLHDEEQYFLLLEDEADLAGLPDNLREAVWHMYYSRGDNGGAHDNNAIITEIVTMGLSRGLDKNTVPLNFSVRAIPTTFVPGVDCDQIEFCSQHTDERIPRTVLRF
jgi:Zn-dependent oligopeptidase